MYSSWCRKRAEGDPYGGVPQEGRGELRCPALWRAALPRLRAIPCASDVPVRGRGGGLLRATRHVVQILVQGQCDPIHSGHPRVSVENIRDASRRGLPRAGDASWRGWRGALAHRECRNP
eukprot:scaffold464_cov244-Pinguiococcus_pyrenoidosus.AAC.7